VKKRLQRIVGMGVETVRLSGSLNTLWNPKDAYPGLGPSLRSPKKGAPMAAKL
jgi:hypothetical protein